MPPTPPVDYKYWVFISYSHADAKWGKWLHRALETYRVPRALVGRAARDGQVPKRVFPVFRDREELPTSSDLSSNIDDALHGSRYLVVICSPRAAVSRWVNEEIKAFKALGRADRVLCLVVDGEPNASDRPDSGLLECFPQAVRHDVSLAGDILESRAEPIAADVRPGKDGRSNARLKLLAGVLGVNFDDLRQREKRRRFWRRMVMAAAMLTIAAALGAVWYRGHTQTLVAEAARNERLAQLMIEKSKDALRRGDEATATFYGAHAIEYSLLAGEREPLNSDLLASLSLSALPAGDVPGAGFAAALAASPGSGELAWARADGSLVIWDAVAKKRLRRLSAEDGPITAACFDPTGRLLATAGQNEQVLVRDVETGAVVAALGQGTELLRTVAFSPDGKLLAAAGDDRAIHLWRMGHPTEIRVLRGHTDRVNAVAFSPDGRLLVSISQDRTMRVWDVVSGAPLAPSHRYGEPPRSIAFSHDGSLLAVGLFDTTARLWSTVGNAAAWHEIATLSGHKKTVETLGFSPDDQVLATGSADKTIGLWDVSARDQIATLTGQTDALSGIAFAGDGHLLAAASEDGAVRFWRLVPRRYEVAIPAHAGPVRAVAFDPVGGLLATAGDDTKVRLWNLARRQVVYEFDGHDDSVRGVAFSPDGKLLASVGRDHRINLWDLAAHRLVARVANAHDDWIFGVAFSSDGRLLATAGWDNKVKLWNVPGLTLAGTLEGHTKPVGGVAFAPHGSVLASASNDDTVRLWDTRTMRPLRVLRGHTEVVRPLAFRPDGTLLASGSGDTQVKLWDMSRGVEVASLPGHYSYMVWALAFSPDGRLLATGSQSDDRQTVRLWDVARRTIVARLAGHRGFALSLAFSPDGTQLVSGGADGTIRLWRVADFWPRRESPADGDPGALLQPFLAHPPYRIDEAHALACRVGHLTGLELVGTDAMPSAGTAEGCSR